MDKLFEKLPYDDLDGLQFSHLLAGAAGIGLVLFIAYYFTLYSATSTEFEKLTKEKIAAERTLKRYKATVAKKDKVAKKLALAKGRLDAYKSQIPSPAEIPNLMQRIAEFGKHRNMQMVALTVEEGTKSMFVDVIPLKIQLQGELWATLDFLDYMQNLLRLVSFDNLRLEAQPLIAGVRGEGATVGSLRTSLRVKTYSFREGAEDFKPAKKAPPKKKAKKKKKGH